jgi:hypothetical protein
LALLDVRYQVKAVLQQLTDHRRDRVCLLILESGV